MKRYGIKADCTVEYMNASMYESPDGDYVLYSDLITAGCLVPVPVKLVINQLPCYVLFDGKVWRVWKRQVTFPNRLILHGIYDDDVSDADETDCVPIRLVPLEELK